MREGLQEERTDTESIERTLEKKISKTYMTCMPVFVQVSGTTYLASTIEVFGMYVEEYTGKVYCCYIAECFAGCRKFKKIGESGIGLGRSSINGLDDVNFKEY